MVLVLGIAVPKKLRLLYEFVVQYQVRGQVVTRAVGKRVIRPACNRINRTGFQLIVDTCRLVLYSRKTGVLWLSQYLLHSSIIISAVKYVTGHVAV